MPSGSDYNRYNDQNLLRLGNNTSDGGGKQLDAFGLIIERFTDSQKENSDKLTDSNNKLIKSNISGADKVKLATDALNKLQNGLKSLQTSLDKTMTDFVESQEKMAYNLDGSSKTLKDVTATLSDSINGTGIVQQKRVYQNLTELVQQGIVNNVEQRAYLQTLSNDLGMKFKANDASLNRLIKLQQADLSSHRMSIEASLKEFLNINFKTSEYIHQGFENVTRSLLEAQSLMTASNAMALESSVQKWMGALSSAGMSDETVSAIAQAIGDLGSGNYEVLSSNVGTLLNMAAARAGLPIGQILNQGLTADNTDVLMRSLISYMSEIGGENSNVVKSAYSKLFGFNVSDLVSATNISGAINDKGTLIDAIDDTVIGTNISELLKKTDGFIYTTTKIQNTLENLMYKMAVTTASDSGRYLTYKGLSLAGQVAAPLLMAGGHPILSTVAEYAPLLSVLGINAFDSATKFSKKDGLKRAFSFFSNLFGGREEGSSALGIYNRLGEYGGNFFSHNTIETLKGSIATFDRQSGKNTSGTGFKDDALGSKTSSSVDTDFLDIDVVEGRTIDDVYNRITDVVNTLVDLPNQPFGTVTRIAEAGNTVSIGQDSALMQDMVTFMAMNVQNIYSLLLSRFTGNVNANVVDTNSMNWNTSFEWMTKTIGGNA